MTPTERARQIDSQEFKAESQAALKRALAYSKQVRKQEQQRVKAWIDDKGPIIITPKAITVSHMPAMHVVNGVSRTMKGWADHLGITKAALISRRKRLGSMEAAVALGSGDQRGSHWATRRQTQPHTPTPGVSANFLMSEGTGAGSDAHEIPEISFSDLKAPTT